MSAYRNVRGLAGAVTQPGATIKTVNVDSRFAAGTPLKIADGKGVELASGDDINAMWGVVVRNDTCFEPEWDLLQSVLFDGTIQVPMTEEEIPVRGQPVYYNATTHKFTTTAASMIPVRAVWAADGQADGVAEIQVLHAIAAATGA